MRCEVHCPKKSGAAAAVVGVAVVVVAVSAPGIAGIAKAAALAILSLCAAGTVAVAWLAWRGRVRVAAALPAAAQAAPRRAITAGQPMIEGKTVRVVPGMIVKGAAKEEARHG